jgi:hypothetical protein
MSLYLGAKKSKIRIGDKIYKIKLSTSPITPTPPSPPTPPSGEGSGLMDKNGVYLLDKNGVSLIPKDGE